MVSIEKTFKLRSINYCNNGPAEGCYAGYRSPRVGETQRKDFFFIKPEIHFRADRTRDIERDIEVEVLTITVETFGFMCLLRSARVRRLKAVRPRGCGQRPVGSHERAPVQRSDPSVHEGRWHVAAAPQERTRHKGTALLAAGA